MGSDKKPRWALNVTIEKGNIAINLIKEDLEHIENRLQPGFVTDLDRYVAELSGKSLGQTKNLVNQTTLTEEQNTGVANLHEKNQMIKNLVKAETEKSAILKKYGIGKKFASTTVMGVMEETNVIIDAFEDDPEWAVNKANIIEDDIVDLMESSEQLSSTDTSQETSKLVRKVKTKSKDSLQVQVEKMVRKISNIGILVFSKQNPERVSLYRDLIP